MDPQALQEFMNYLNSSVSQPLENSTNTPEALQDAARTFQRMRDAKWAGMPGVSGLPDQAVDASQAIVAKNNFTDWITQAPNKAFQGMRETMGPVLGPSMGNRANVMGGMGDLASRAAIMALMTGPVDDPLASYARFIAGGGQGSPAPQTRL